MNFQNPFKSLIITTVLFLAILLSTKVQSSIHVNSLGQIAQSHYSNLGPLKRIVQLACARARRVIAECAENHPAKARWVEQVDFLEKQNPYPAIVGLLNLSAEMAFGFHDGTRDFPGIKKAAVRKFNAFMLRLYNTHCG